MSARNKKPLNKEHDSRKLGKRAIKAGAKKLPKRGQGSHVVYQKGKLQCTMPDNKDLPIGTQRSIIKVLRQMGVTFWPLIFPLLGAAFILGQR